MPLGSTAAPDQLICQRAEGSSRARVVEWPFLGINLHHRPYHLPPHMQNLFIWPAHCKQSCTQQKKTYRETTVPLSLSPSNRMRKRMEKLSVMMWWVYPYADNANTNNSSCRYYPVNNTFGQFFFKGMKVILILCRVISSHPSMVNFPSQHNAYELDRLLMFIFMGRKKNILALNFPLLLMIKKLIKY